jgi:dCTP deaminase
VILSDDAIGQAIEDDQVSIDPFNVGQLNPASYDLRLGPELLVAEWTPSNSRWTAGIRTAPLDLRAVSGQADYLLPIEPLEQQPYLLEPGEFVLASTAETVRLSRRVAGRVEGKSSLARVGLAVHVTGGFIDPGFQGQITLEIANLLHRPLTLYAGMRIAQIAFTPVAGRVRSAYGSGSTGHYQHQTGPTLSRYRLDVEGEP